MLEVHTSECFSADIVQDPNRIRELESEIKDLLKRTGQSHDLTKTAAYFLARIREKRARPFVTAVYEHKRLIGIVYGAKLCFLGIPIGVIECGDSCGDGSVLSLREYFTETVNTALAAIQRERFIYLGRISWKSETVGAAAVAKAITLDVWNHLSLEPTYELFLEKLGSQTRRNMRYYRRRAEQEEWVFAKDIDRNEAFAAIRAIHPTQEVGQKSRAHLDRNCETLNDVPGAFFSGLRTPGGEWISVICGWVKGQTMFIFLQVNRATYAKASVSTVLRGYVIEAAIADGIRVMKFIDGCGGNLKKYTGVKSSHLLVQKPGYVSRGIQYVSRRFFRFSALTRLIVESSARE